MLNAHAAPFQSQQQVQQQQQQPVMQNNYGVQQQQAQLQAQMAEMSFYQQVAVAFICLECYCIMYCNNWPWPVLGI